MIHSCGLIKFTIIIPPSTMKPKKQQKIEVEENSESDNEGKNCELFEIS